MQDVKDKDSMPGCVLCGLRAAVLSLQCIVAGACWNSYEAETTNCRYISSNYPRSKIWWFPGFFVVTNCDIFVRIA